MSLSARERLIVALDTNDLGQAEAIISDLTGLVGPYKIGKEAITAGIGHTLADMVIAAGGTVFWDGKFNDIPNTVEGASKALTARFPTGVWALNVHASGGRKMMEAAVRSRGGAAVLAVTVLTSLNDEDALYLFGLNVYETVLRWARLACQAGVQGIICSPREVSGLRADPEMSKLIRVTPAIRPEWSVPADQERPTTPKQAMENGSDLIVVGRPVTNPPSGWTRRSAAEAILEEIERGLEEKERG